LRQLAVGPDGAAAFVEAAQPVDGGEAAGKKLSFKDKVKKSIASRNWTRTLGVLTCLSGAGLVAAGVLGMMNIILPSTVIISAYMVVFGILLWLILVPFPQAWKKLNMKWVPFLHTFRGRGLFLIFLGTLATSLGIASVFIGIVIILIGLAHVILACYFRNTLDPSEDFNKHSQQVEQVHGDQPAVTGATGGTQSPSSTGSLTSVIAQAAWDNRSSIAQAAYDNRNSIADVAVKSASNKV